MKVAIIDDELHERKVLSEYISTYGSENGLKVGIELFESGDMLIGNYKADIDILVFDIDMPGTNGMECARKIREIDKNVTILFVTNIAQYAIDGYAVEAIDYIIKPISYYEFSMKFQKAVSKVAQKREHMIAIDTGEGIRRLKTSEVLYVEVMAHYLFFHLKKEVFKVRGSMKEQLGMLIPFNFCRVHKSFLINLKYVEEIQKNEVLVGGKSIPIGRMYKDALMQEYMRYIRG